MHLTRGAGLDRVLSKTNIDPLLSNAKALGTRSRETF